MATKKKRSAETQKRFERGRAAAKQRVIERGNHATDERETRGMNQHIVNAAKAERQKAEVIRRTIEYKKDLIEKAKGHFNRMFKDEERTGIKESLDFFQELLGYEKVNTELIFSLVVQQLEYDLALLENVSRDDSTNRKWQEVEESLPPVLNDLFNAARKNNQINLPEDKQWQLVNFELTPLAAFYKLEERESKLINRPIEQDNPPLVLADDRKKLLKIISDIDQLEGSLNAVLPFYSLYDLGKGITNIENIPGKWAPWRSFNGLLAFTHFILNQLQGSTKLAIAACKPNKKGQPQDNRARRLGLAIKKIFDNYKIDDRNLFTNILDVIARAGGSHIESIEHIVDKVYKTA